MGETRSPLAGQRRGVNASPAGRRITASMQSLYAGANRADKIAMTRAFNSGAKGVAGLRKAVDRNNKVQESRRPARAAAAGRRAQVAFDRRLVNATTARERYNIRRDAPAGVNARDGRGRGPMNAARANVAAANARARIPAPAAPAAPARPRRPRPRP